MSNRERSEKYQLPSGHPGVPAARTGVLLINLGTPEGTDYFSMRRYLGEFLSDPRVIEVPKLIWQPVLNGIILTFRPRKSGKAYRAIWDRETNESPLRRLTRQQADKLQQKLAPQGIMVDWAMRYGVPSIGDKLAEMQAKGCRRILLMALYPQYSATTTATAYDHSFRALMKMRWQPAIRTAGPYHDHPAYIQALAQSVTNHITTLPEEPEIVLASYHGLPQKYFDKGDPYHCHCHKTTRLLRQALGWPEEKLRTTFQSRFGPQQWLQPYTDVTVDALIQQGIRRITVISPGFAADCVETLEEINQELRHRFLSAGGKQFSMVPCLNDSPGGIAMLETLVRQELSGWCKQ